MKPKNAFILALTAFIWGTSFVSQRIGMNYLEPFTFNGVRSIIGGLTLIPFILFFRSNKNYQRKELITGGVLCGILLFAATSMQQIGIQYTTAGKAGFITAFYIVLVPIYGIFLKKKTGLKVWIAVAIALLGLYFLCITEKFTIGKGDIYIFICALIFACHILVIDYFSPKVSGIKMSCIQFLVCGIISIPFMFILETPKISAMTTGILPLLYAGIFSCGIAYTLQILGQKNANPAIASLIMSLESCFSVLSGWLILGERMSAKESAGCVLMFAAIIIAQLPGREKAD